MQNSPLVTASWLADRLHEPDIKLLDSSWHMPNTGRSGQAEYAENHISGAQFFDVDKIADTTSGLPHMLPTAALFGEKVSALGISNQDTIIVYSNGDVPTAARAWWMFRVMGHDNVYVLDGGYAAWLKIGGKVDNQPAARPVTSFKAVFQPHLVTNANTVLGYCKNGLCQIVDARATARFEGSVPEPRAGLRSGHIPGSISLPQSDLYQPDGILKPAAALSEIFRQKSINLKNPIITSCGSGITACTLALAFAVLGKWDTAVYDGSWTEWGADTRLPVETGN